MKTRLAASGSAGCCQTIAKYAKANSHASAERHHWAELGEHASETPSVLFGAPQIAGARGETVLALHVIPPGHRIREHCWTVRPHDSKRCHELECQDVFIGWKFEKRISGNDRETLAWRAAIQQIHKGEGSG